MLLAFTFDSIIYILSLVNGATAVVQMFIIPILFYIEKKEVGIFGKIFGFILLLALVFIGTYNLNVFIFNSIYKLI